ncbi:MAG TPA: efflux RND transporter periplasmic adaptor subunit [Thermodesulfobacteriota bacterium]|nr:efflux RND transporter periplasmic adaptor subunit [Thermodesulfobacteriota bacterium]
MKWINKKTVAGLIVIVLLGIFVVPRFLGGNDSRITYRTAEADRDDVISLITATGTLNPLTTIGVGSQVQGTVSNINADFNSGVKKGDPLLEIDPGPLKIELKRAEASMKKAEADFGIASSLYKANKELYEKRLIPKEEFDDSQSKYSAALAAFDQSKVALEIAKTNLDNTVVRSPIDGIVLSRSINAGESVTPGGKALFVISNDLTEMKIDTKVSEADIGKLVPDQKAYFKVDAYPGETFEGTVSQVRNEPIITNNVVTYNVVVETGNEDRKLKPGMTAEVKIVVADKKDVLRVPTAALRFIPPSSADIKERPDELSDNSYVWITLRNGQIGALPVKTGVSDDIYTEILDGGLKEGQKVIVEAVAGSKSNGGSSYLPQPRRF